MTDEDRIRDLCFTYTYRLDDGDFAGVAELLASATLQPSMPGVLGGEINGRDAIEAFYRSQVVTYSRGRPMTRHLITNQIIRIDDDRRVADSRSCFTVLQRPPAIDFHVVAGGQYLDEFAEVGGAWRFTRKTIQVDHVNDIEHHFIVAPERSS